MNKAQNIFSFLLGIFVLILFFILLSTTSYYKRLYEEQIIDYKKSYEITIDSLRNDLLKCHKTNQLILKDYADFVGYHNKLFFNANLKP